MNDQAKQKINNILSLVKERKSLMEELKNLYGYKIKIQKVREKYAGKSRGSKTRGRKSTNGGGKAPRRG